MQRREVYATTGPRMTVRFSVAGTTPLLDASGDLAAAGYAKGVPMGGTWCRGRGQIAHVLVAAMKD
jgi:hypothetical protein